jgi:hypothetical protein
MPRRRIPVRGRALARVLPLLCIFSCGEITGDDSPGRWISGYITDQPIPAANTTFSDPVFFSVADEDGGVPDVEVHFSVRGDATVDPVSARTDEHGSARTRLTFGDALDRVFVTARIAGTSDSAMVSVVPVRRTLVLSPDSMRILAGCGLWALVRIGPPETFVHDPDNVDPGVRFELRDSSVAHLVLGGGTDYRRPKRGVIADRVGRTDLIASFAGAVPDTTPVEVIPATASDADLLSLSGTTSLELGGEPGSVIAIVFTAGGCPLLDLRPVFSSRSPEVVAIGAHEESPDGEPGVQLLPRALGSAWIVGELGALADSILVEVH